MGCAAIGRPDFSFAVSVLTTQVSSWSRASDKQLRRLVSYLASSLDYKLTCASLDDTSTCFFSLYVDGMFLVMQGQNGTFWPIHWYARRQKCVSRSTTEAETVALAEGAYEDALPSMFLLDTILPSMSIPLVVLEDNQAVIQVVEKGFSVKLRHLPRTQR